jgi:hypothetical protein
VLGRLKASSSILAARSEMDAIAPRLREQYPLANDSLGVTTEPLVESRRWPHDATIAVAPFGSVAFVLLTACCKIQDKPIST